MFLVVGLGNPGAEYANTRHNVGFMAADEIHRRYNFSAFRAKFDGLIAEGNIDGEKVYLLKPQTFMNLSGNSVVKAASFYKILPQNIVVIHDDMDLPIDKMKAKIGGGAGGHNGLKSIDSCITPNYNRIRLGIGHPNIKAEEVVVNHVLSSFSKADKAILEQNIDIVADLLPILLKKGIAEFSNQLGMKLNKR
jgi:PTH1 family peptidyl-tRNA hydrolase